MILLISLIAFCYLYTCYNSKKLYGLQIIAFSIIVSEILSFYTNFKLLPQIIFFIGSIGFIPILKPIKLSIINKSDEVKDFFFWRSYFYYNFIVILYFEYFYHVKNHISLVYMNFLGKDNMMKKFKNLLVFL